MINYLQKKNIRYIFSNDLCKVPIICGSKYNRAVILFLVFTGTGR